MIAVSSAVSIPLHDGSVQCVVTSPPYWGLRDYGLPPIAWGGDPGCRHRWGNEVVLDRRGLQQGKASSPDARGAGRGSCCACGAWRGQLGLESTVALYVKHLVEIFREVRRVLAPWGSCWVNLGDTYTSQGFTRQGRPRKVPQAPNDWAGTSLGGRRRAAHAVAATKDYGSLGPGNLAGVPWRVAFALQDDGWVLRSEVIWAKPAPMPESVSGWRWERHRVRTGNTRQTGKIPAGWRGASNPTRNERRDTDEPIAQLEDCSGCPKCEPNDGLVLRRGSWRPTRAHEQIFQFAKGLHYFGDGEAVREPATDTGRVNGRDGRNEDSRARPPSSSPRTLKRLDWTARGRNPRSVWTISSEPYAGEHFATFPSALVERCIKSSTPEAGSCSDCGAPWVPVVDAYRTQVLSHRPTCYCSASPCPALVLDPFGGSGTVADVALRLGLNAVSLDLSLPYSLLAQERIATPSMVEMRGGRLRPIEGPLFQ